MWHCTVAEEEALPGRRVCVWGREVTSETEGGESWLH